VRTTALRLKAILARALVALALQVGLWTASARADSAQPDAITAAASRRAEAAFQKAFARFHAATNDPDAQLQFGRACFDWADCATSDSQREKIAQQGIDTCRQLVKQDPKSAPGHYYLGMNLGELAETKELGAISIVSEMEAVFRTAATLDEKFDYAGPDRNLGLLYLQAPGWPISVGDNAKARAHLQRAVKLSPDYPENLLNLIEAEIQWGDQAGARRELAALEKTWPAAQKQFTGDEWAATRADWEKRRAAAGPKVAEAPKPLKPTRKPD
jgi:tetratricopeptide (TPR) repeat protein